MLLEEPQLIDQLWANTKFFKEGLKALGFDAVAPAGLADDFEPHTFGPLPVAGDRWALLGYEDEPRGVVETIAVVALNIYTNLIGKATQVDIDFPKVALLGAPAARTAAQDCLSRPVTFD